MSGWRAQRYSCVSVRRCRSLREVQREDSDAERSVPDGGRGAIASADAERSTSTSRRDAALLDVECARKYRPGVYEWCADVASDLRHIDRF